MPLVLTMKKTLARWLDSDVGYSFRTSPVAIGAGAIVAAGSVITQDVEADSLALVRPPQTVRAGWAKRFRDAMLARKAPT